MEKAINEAVYLEACLLLKQMGKKRTVFKKLQAVIAAYQHGVRLTSQVMGVSRSSIYVWAAQIKAGAPDQLINKSKHSDGIKLKSQHKEAIAAWLEVTPHLTIREVQQRLKEAYDLSVSKSTVHRAIRSRRFSYITGRKRHYKQNKQAKEAFKKITGSTSKAR